MGASSLVTTWFGVFLIEDGETVEHRLFPEDSTKIADRMALVRAGEVLDEERELAEDIDAFTVVERRVLSLPGASIGEPASTIPDPAEHGVDPKLGREAALELTQRVVREGLSEPDRHLMHAVSYLDEAHETENLLGERLVSWFTLHAPEVVERCEDHLELAQLVAKHGTRDAILEAKGWPSEGLGGPLGDAEREAIDGLATSLVEQAAGRAPLEAFVEEEARKMAPNVSKLVGPKIAGRLIYYAGGLRELATAPASTIQMLGAEKAVFKHLVEGAPPPKHGVIFQHPLIYQAHPKDRGKISRALAAKIAIASRADAFTGNDIAAELKAEVEARAEEVSRVGRRKAMKKRGGES